MIPEFWSVNACPSSTALRRFDRFTRLTLRIRLPYARFTSFFELRSSMQRRPDQNKSS